MLRADTEHADAERRKSATYRQFDRLRYMPTRNTEKVALVVVHIEQFCRPPGMAFFFLKSTSEPSSLNMTECCWRPATCFDFHGRNGGASPLFGVAVYFTRLLSQLSRSISETQKDQKEASREFQSNYSKVPAGHMLP